MKKINLLLLTIIALLFTQCKPDTEENNNDNADKIRVSCVLPLNKESRSDFTKLMTDGSVNWSDGRECIYLVIPGNAPKIVELEGYSEGYHEAIEFSAFVDEKLLATGTTYEIWYFGNSSQTNTPYYNLVDNNRIEGSISFQSGRLADLGYCHVANTTVTAVMEDGEVRLPISGTLKNRMSIALLDLNGVTSLSGNAIYGTSYSLEYNTVSKNYEFSVTPDADANISVESATGISYVVLFPNEDYDVALQCKKDDKNYEYVFRNGIAANKVYYRAEQNGDVSCLPWTEYKDNSGEDGGDEGGNEEIIDGKVRLFAKGVTLTSGWYDVNKIGNGTVNGDINMCWAATSSNIIQWWQDRYVEAGNALPAGAVTGPGTKYQLALMEMYHEQWDNSRGGDASHGVTWYFEGKNLQRYASAGTYAQPKEGCNGAYFASVWNEILPHVYHGYSQSGYSDLITQEYNNYTNWYKNENWEDYTNSERIARFSNLVKTFMERGMCALGVSTSSTLASSHHSVTLWGCEYDVATGLLTKIWITDSDDQSKEPKTTVLHECTVSIYEGTGKIKLEGAAQTYYAVSLFPVSGYGSL